MLWSVIRVIFKTSSVTPDFFYVFNLALSFSTYSQSFNKICVWDVLGANVLKTRIKTNIIRNTNNSIEVWHNSIRTRIIASSFRITA